MITGRSCSTCQMQCKCCFTYRRTGSNNDLLTGLPAACHPVKVGKSCSQSWSTVLVAGHAGLYQLIVSSISCDVERRCSAVPHSFSNRSRRVWASASVSSISVILIVGKISHCHLGQYVATVKQPVKRLIIHCLKYFSTLQNYDSFHWMEKPFF
jgi:hypothetical protein